MVYDDLGWPSPPKGRPYIALNMIVSLDGKIVSGERSEPARFGSDTDKATMRVIEQAVDGVIVGRGTLDATPGIWYPAPQKRYVVTESGEIKVKGRFFTDQPELAFVVTSTAGAMNVPAGAQVVAAGQDSLDLAEALRTIRQDHEVKVLLAEGGSEFNASLFKLDVVDEFFLTVSPFVKMGREVPTPVGGDPLPFADLRRFDLVSAKPVANEVFLRYRRSRS